jgi:hypothetical protein
MRRFNMALGLDILAIDQPVNAERHFAQWGHLIIGAVDNHLARRELAKVKGAVWIDAGNHFNAGQVCIGNTSNPDLAMRYIDQQEGKCSYLPNASLLFPALLEPEAESTTGWRRSHHSTSINYCIVNPLRRSCLMSVPMG